MLFIGGSVIQAADPAANPPAPKPKIQLIYDGDIGPDPCDFTTLSMLHEYHKHGLIDLLGVAGEAPDPYLASTFSIYNQVYKNDIPIGQRCEAFSLGFYLSQDTPRHWRDRQTLAIGGPPFTAGSVIGENLSPAHSWAFPVGFSPTPCSMWAGNAHKWV